MATTTVTRPALSPGRAGAPPTGPVLRGGIRPARVLLGVLLVLLSALAGVVVAVRVDSRVPVLAAAKTIGAGQVVTAADVMVVKVAADAGLATVPAAQLSTVVGRVAAVPLVAGTLLSPAQFGGPRWPGSGQSVIAVAVKPGRLPSGLGAGAQVVVLVVPGSIPGAAAGPDGGLPGPVQRATATVVSAEAAADQSGSTVVTLLLPAGDAVRIASATGDTALILVGG